MKGRIVTVVIADDHPIVLKGVADLLESCGQVRVLATCQDGISAIEAVRNHAPDVAVLDLAMPGANGLKALESIKAEMPGTNVVLLTGQIAGDQIARALAAGAKAILLKDSALEELVSCVQAVADGRKWVSASLLEYEREFRANRGSIEQALTEREREIMRLVARGLSNKSVARRLELSEGTVKGHLHNIYRKTGTSNRTELAVLALAHFG
jgi:two-component system, NarL family, nitrate/nitrite response regulator NarL